MATANWLRLAAAFIPLLDRHSSGDDRNHQFVASVFMESAACSSRQGEGGQQRERREERADAEREKKSSPLAVILDWCASRQMSLFDRIDPMGKKGRKRGCRVRFKKYGALTRLLKEGF